MRPFITELMELKIVKNKFEEYKLYDIYDYNSNNTSNTNIGTPSINNSSYKINAEDKYDTLERENSSKDNTKESYKDINSTQKNTLEIEVEIDFNTNKKRLEPNNSKKRISSKYMNNVNTNNNNDMSNISGMQSKNNKIKRQVTIILLISKEMYNSKRGLSYGVQDIGNILTSINQDVSPIEEKRINYPNNNNYNQRVMQYGNNNQSYIGNMNMNQVGQYNYDESPSSIFQQNLTSAKSNPNFNKKNKQQLVRNYSNANFEPSENKSYYINNESNYNNEFNGISYSIYDRNDTKSPYYKDGNTPYKILSSNGHINNNNNSRLNKNQKNPKNQQISINISDQSPSNIIKDRGVLKKGDSMKHLHKIQSELGSISRSNFENVEISPVNENFQPTTTETISGSGNKRFNLIELLKNNSQSPQGVERPMFMMNFLKERYGKEKFTNLISMIEESENPFSLLEDESQIKAIVGEDYKLASKFLTYVVKALKTSQKLNMKKAETDF